LSKRAVVLVYWMLGQDALSFEFLFSWSKIAVTGCLINDDP
jgi:hypothetical protein